MAEAERPDRLNPARRVTVEDVRTLMGASTPHFAMQLRNRIAKLIRGLPADDPARVEGEREIARLESLGFTGEIRGEQGRDGERPLRSVSDTAVPRRGSEATRRIPGSH
jgi:hypothetical protein